MLESLIKLGLSEKEAKVYLATLELSSDSVQNISKKAKVNRATTYVILEKLINLGLVSTHEQDKKTVFIAEDPRELANILEEEKRLIDSRKQYLEDVMNQLQAIYNLKRDKPIVRYFEGAEGLEALDRYGHDQFKKGSEIIGIIPIDLIEEQFPQRRKSAIQDRVKKGIKSRMIYTHKNGKIPNDVNSAELREGIFIPRSDLPLDGTIQVYPEWGIKLYYFSKKSPHGVLIQSPELANNMKIVMELAWIGAKSKQK